MTNEEYEQAVARADDELDMLKDTCHDQYDRIQELEKRIDFLIDVNDEKQIIINNAIEYIENHDLFLELIQNEKAKNDLLIILQGGKYGN